MDLLTTKASFVLGSHFHLPALEGQACCSRHPLIPTFINALHRFIHFFYSGTNNVVCLPWSLLLLLFDFYEINLIRRNKGDTIENLTREMLSSLLNYNRRNKGPSRTIIT